MTTRDPNKPKGKAPRRLTLEEVDNIIHAYLNGDSYATIAAEQNVDRGTVKTRWKQWLAETSEERREELESERSENIEKAKHIANIALQDASKAKRIVYTKSGDEIEIDHAGDKARSLTVALRGLDLVAKVAGFEAPKRVEMQAAVMMTDAQALAILEEDDGDDQ